jgi:hypothetical protein
MISAYIEQVDTYTNNILYNNYYNQYWPPCPETGWPADANNWIDHKYFHAEASLTTGWASALLPPFTPQITNYTHAKFNHAYDQFIKQISDKYYNISNLININSPTIVHDKVKEDLDNLWNEYIPYEKEVLDAVENNYNKSEKLVKKIRKINEFKSKINTIKNIYNFNEDLICGYLVNSKLKKIYDISTYINFDKKHNSWKLELKPYKDLIDNYRMSLKDKFKIVIMPKGENIRKFKYLEDRSGIKIELGDININVQVFINNIINGDIVFSKKYFIENYIMENNFITLIFNKKILKKEVKNIKFCTIYPHYFEKIYMDITYSLLHNYMKTNLPLGKKLRKKFNGNGMSLNDIQNIFTVIEPDIESNKEEIW